MAIADGSAPITFLVHFLFRLSLAYHSFILHSLVQNYVLATSFSIF